MLHLNFINIRTKPNIEQPMNAFVVPEYKWITIWPTDSVCWWQWWRRARWGRFLIAHKSRLAVRWFDRIILVLLAECRISRNRRRHFVRRQIRQELNVDLRFYMFEPYVVKFFEIFRRSLQRCGVSMWCGHVSLSLYLIWKIRIEILASNGKCVVVVRNDDLSSAWDCGH